MLAEPLPAAALAHGPDAHTAACPPRLERAVGAAAATAAASSSNAKDLQGVRSWWACTALCFRAHCSMK